MKPYIMAFVGPVGVGKSTQMRLLAYRLRSKGLKVKTTFLLKGHLFSYFFEIILAKILCKGGWKNTSAMGILLDKNPNAFKKIFKLWLMVDTISICLKFLVSIYIPIKLGNIVLVEDYIPSTITHYGYYCQRLKLPVNSVNFSLKLALSLMSHFPTWVIFQDAQTEVLESRWRAKNLSIDEDYVHYTRRKVLLLLLQKLLPDKLVYIVTNNRSVSEVHKLITKRIEL
jgi:thymidylate kinase